MEMSFLRWRMFLLFDEQFFEWHALMNSDEQYGLFHSSMYLFQRPHLQAALFTATAYISFEFAGARRILVSIFVACNWSRKHCNALQTYLSTPSCAVQAFMKQCETTHPLLDKRHAHGQHFLFWRTVYNLWWLLKETLSE